MKSDFGIFYKKGKKNYSEMNHVFGQKIFFNSFCTFPEGYKSL